MRTKTALGLLLVLAACGGTQTAATTPTADVTDLDRVLAAVRAEDLSYVPIEIEWEQEGERRLIEVEFIRGEEVVERYIDPTTAEVVEEEIDDFSDEAEAAAFPLLRAALASNPIRLEDALANARETYAGDEVVEVEFKFRNERVVVEVEVRRGGELRTYFHDPVSGERLPQ